MRKALVGLALMILLAGLALIFGRYDYVNHPGTPPLRVDRFTGRTYALRRGASGGVEWTPLQTPAEAKAAAIKAWGTPEPRVSPH